MRLRDRSIAWLVAFVVMAAFSSGVLAADKGCGSSGKSPDPKADPNQEKQPKFVCEKTSIAHEDIWTGTKVKYTFTFKNDGDADLHIKAKGG